MGVGMRMAGVAAAAVTAVAAAGGPALASTSKAEHGGPGRGAQHVVYVQTDNPAGNAVVVYRRAHNGTLTQAGEYSTGGLGGILAGSQVDHLASQGSLAYDADGGALIAVNAGSDTVSVFDTAGDRLRLRQVIDSGGSFPVSVATYGNLVYVLNALAGGSVQGYRLVHGRLVPLPDSSRALGLDPTAAPQFTNTPGQVAFSPDGTQVIVATKMNGNDVDVFAVNPGGTLSAAPVVNSEPGTVPFGIAFDHNRHLVIAEAGTNALATFALGPSGTLTQLDQVGTGQAATCWVTPARGLLFASNAGSANLSGYTSGPGGTLTLLGQTATDPGTVDASAVPGGRYLYVQTGGAGTVDEFRVSRDGTLTEIGNVTVPGASGGEGIVAR
jgi:DNA-binding beta-propeller fold protein YncE